MSALDNIRTALATALDTVDGLSAYAVVPGQVNTPAAVVAPDDIEYHTDFDGGATYRFPVQLLVSIGDWGSAQRDLDPLVSHDGAATAAIDALSAYEARVVNLEDYGLTSFGDTNYLGARLIVEVVV